MDSATAGRTFVFSVLIALSLRCAPQQPPKIPAPLGQAESLLHQGRIEDAKKQVLDALQRNPSSADGFDLLGIIFAREQDFPNALAAFQKSLRLAPNSTRTHVNLGNLYVAEKAPADAEKEFRTALRLAPADRDANYNLGVLLMAKGSPAEAIPCFERIHPASVAASFNLVQAYFQTKHPAEALRRATMLSEQNKNDVQVHFTLGVLLASQNQYKSSQFELEQADALQPETFEILYNLGLAYLRSNDNSKAELTLGRALKLKPDSAEALYLLAQVYANQSRPLDALDLLVRAHKLAPQNTDIIFQMAQVSISQNYYEDAIPLLEEGLKIAPRRTDLLATLGESYFMSGQVEKAIEQFKKLIEIEPSARSYAFMGLPYRHLGRFDEAKEYFEKGLKLDPHNSSCLYNLGVIAAKQGDAVDAETYFEQILRTNPNFPEALLELANLRIGERKLTEAVDLLKKYVHLATNPATGYYKLAMAERSLHLTAEADRDMHIFQTLSKDVSSGPYPYEHLFDYLDNRSKLTARARDQLDLTEITEQIKKHPDRPDNLYQLAEAYLKTGKLNEARDAIDQLDKMSSGDSRTLAGIGVLLARYRLYDDAIRHFQAALEVNPALDDVRFDLANTLFRKRQYFQALDAANQVSEDGRKDEAYLALLADIYAHLGDTARAEEIYRSAIGRNPDNDEDYLGLALVQFRQNDFAGAKRTLSQGQTRVPASGKILWGLGLASVLDGNIPQATSQFERAVDLLPEWPGSYSTLGVFYFEMGQVDKAREVLDRFKSSSASGSLDVNRIEQVLAQTPAAAPTADATMTAENRQQLLQFALSLADRTL